MASVNALILEPALREIGVLAAGEAATANDSRDTLAALNALLDQYAAERTAIYTITRTTEALTSAASYTVGSGGDIAIARPVFIDHVNLIDTNQTPDAEYPLHQLTDDEYAALTLKALEAEIPDSWHYEPTFPLGTLRVFPVPTGSGFSLAIYAPTAVTEFAAPTTQVSLPPGYRRMLVKNLAVEIAPSYERQVDPQLAAQAREAKGVVRRANERLSEVRFTADAMVGNRAFGLYDIGRM